MQAGNRTFIGFGLSIPSDNVLTSDPFFLSELVENGGEGVNWENGHDHRHFALSDGNYKSFIEIQYFNKRKTNPVFWGIKFNMVLPFKDSDYGYSAGNSYSLALSSLFKPNFKILGPKLGPRMKHASKIINELSNDDIFDTISEHIILSIDSNSDYFSILKMSNENLPHIDVFYSE